MSITTKIEEIWNNSSDTNLNDVFDNILSMLYEAKKKNEIVPINLEVDIILKANSIIGFGNKNNEAKYIMDLYHRSINFNKELNSSNHCKLAATAAGILISILSNDESSNIRYANKLMENFNIDERSTRIQIIRKFYESLIAIISNREFSSWTLEALAFVITFYCLLMAYDEITEHDKYKITELSKLFSKKLNDKQITIFNNWKKSWLEKSDYFRFSALMIFGKHPDEELWINTMNEFIINQNI